MKENDYYGHYKAFVEELKQNPEQTLQVYCREHGVVWRRLYDWMRRHHISLKKIYQTYRQDSAATSAALTYNNPVDFRELIPVQGGVRGKGRLSADVISGGIRIDLRSGISISIGECSVPVLAGIINSLAGKEGRDVLA